MYRIMYLLLDWEGCRLLAVGAPIFSGITAGRDQELLSRAAPPFMAAKAMLSKSRGDPKAHFLVYWVEPLLTGRFFPVSHLTL